MHLKEDRSSCIKQMYAGLLSWKQTNLTIFEIFKILGKISAWEQGM